MILGCTQKYRQYSFCVRFKSPTSLSQVPVLPFALVLSKPPDHFFLPTFKLSNLLLHSVTCRNSLYGLIFIQCGKSQQTHPVYTLKINQSCKLNSFTQLILFEGFHHTSPGLKPLQKLQSNSLD